MTAALEELIAREIAQALPPDLAALAAAVRARYPNALGLLVYGSTLRGVPLTATLADVYVLLARDADAGAGPLSRLGQRLLPPNVYAFEAGPHSAKIAVLTLDAFAYAMGPHRRDPYFWARFAQPVRLAHAADDTARHHVIAALAQAHRTLYGHGAALAADPLQRFEQAFRRTYACELRSEGPGRAASIVADHQAYFSSAAAAMAGAPSLYVNWPQRRLQGKTLSVLRLTKAAFTYAGGADYIAGKIERHSGERLTLTPWQRRHPLLAGLMLLPRLLRRGAIK